MRPRTTSTSPTQVAAMSSVDDPSTGARDAPPGRGSSARPNMATSTASTAPAVAIHSGFDIHHHPVAAAGVGSPNAITSTTAAITRAVRCQRNSVMIRAFTATVTLHGRRPASHRFSVGRAAIARPTSASVSTRMQSVGGLMFDTASSGTPTMLTG